MQESIMEIVMIVLPPVVTIIAILVVDLVRKIIGLETMKRISFELDVKEKLAIMAVRFVEQAYRDFKGPQKLTQASVWLTKHLNHHGFKITTDEVTVLIEAALKTLKDEFGEAWKEQLLSETP